MPLDTEQVVIELYERQRADSDAAKRISSLEEEEEETKLSDSSNVKRPIESSLGARETELGTRSASDLNPHLQDPPASLQAVQTDEQRLSIDSAKS